MSYICRYYHKHRTETGVEYCHLATPWHELESQIESVPWNPEGTTEEWSDLGRFRPLFWNLMRYHILRRDRVCQYEPCGISHEQRGTRSYQYTLEVHHIIPRRLGGTDHPANLISLCHDHHRIQPAHHHDAGLVIRDADIPTTPFQPRRIRQARPKDEMTLDMF
jgi:hypothetical protein